MREPQTVGSRQVVAVVMMFSAVSLVALAAPFADLLVGIWFFRKGQSS